MSVPIRWTVWDRHGQQVALSDERWNHIIHALNHPELADHEENLKTTVRLGRRRQDPENPKKYFYEREFPGLTAGNTHVVAIVLLGNESSEHQRRRVVGRILTAYLKYKG